MLRGDAVTGAAGVVVGLLAGVSLAVTASPHRGPALVRARRQASGTAGGAVAAGWGRRRRACSEGGDGRLAAALVEAAALLRAGTAPSDAWSRVLGVPVADRVPTVAELAAVAGTGRRPRGSPGPPLGAVVAAARVADELGAPLATVLDQVAAAIAAQAEAAADVDAALAGPRASARVLAWLPVLGVVLGTALGADPVGVLLGGGAGTVAGVGGLLLTAAGRWWSTSLLRRVGRAVGP